MFGGARRRIQAEFKKLKANPTQGVYAVPVNENNLFLWEVTVNGPPGSCYEGGVFVARLEFPENYPAEPPKMKFVTPIFHPNVYSDGRVCISILHPFGKDPFENESPKERWNPLLGIDQIVLSVMSILADPNPNSPANLEASIMFNNNHTEFVKRAKLCAVKSYEEAQRKSIIQATNKEYEEALKADIQKDAQKEEMDKKKKLEIEMDKKKKLEMEMEKEKKENHVKEAAIDRKVTKEYNKSTKRNSNGEEKEKETEEKGKQEERKMDDPKTTMRNHDGDESENKTKKLLTVTEEPSIDCGKDMVKIRFTLPIAEPTQSHPWQNITRRFLKTDEVSTVLNFIASEGFEVSDFKVLWSFPPKDLCQEDSKQTFQTLGFDTRVTEVIRLRKKSLDVD